MDRIDEMRIFSRVVEARSFRRAASGLGLPPSTVSDAVKRMEKRLGVRLLDRTTRVVAPTLDGEAWYRRCLSIVAQVEDGEAAFSGGTPSGRLHVNVHGTLARHFVLPHLGTFMADYPDIELVLSDSDRLVDLVREGVDCVIRVGVPADSDLIARRLGVLEEVTCAAPSYLAKFGTPENVEDLDGHEMVGFLSSATDMVMPMDFQIDGKEVNKILPSSVLVTTGDMLAEAGRQGFGLIQVPRYHVMDDLQTGRLINVLPQMPPSGSQVSALYPRDRQLSPRLRVFLAWLDGIKFGKSDEN